MNDLIQKIMMKSAIIPAWIGLTDKTTEGKWEYTNGGMENYQIF